MRVLTNSGRVVEGQTEAFVAALIMNLPQDQLNKVLAQVEESRFSQELYAPDTSPIIRPN